MTDGQFKITDRFVRSTTKDLARFNRDNDVPDVVYMLENGCLYFQRKLYRVDERYASLFDKDEKSGEMKTLDIIHRLHKTHDGHHCIVLHESDKLSPGDKLSYRGNTYRVLIVQDANARYSKYTLEHLGPDTYEDE